MYYFNYIRNENYIFFKINIVFGKVIKEKFFVEKVIYVFV